ncbi:hypothetical protein BDZ89DRAFT_1134879 [Hymenopellis radicata]|nr:hypothetical protein BDZ89DRAFT_1134879 [Hymenopellis radicata]
MYSGLTLNKKRMKDNCKLAYKMNNPVILFFALASPSWFFAVFMSSGSDVFDDSADALSGFPANNLLAGDASDSENDEDDPGDLSYAPPNQTPNHRNYKDEPRDPHLAERSDAVAKHPGTCAFTAEKNVCATVQYAHGTARNLGYKRPDMMINLEYYWGFPTPYTLSLDTRNNIFPANPTNHVGYDKGGYGVLPQLDALVNIFEDSKVIEKLPLTQRKRYNILWPAPVDDPYWKYNPLMFRFKADSAPIITYRDPVPDANGNRPTTQHYCPYPNLQLVLRLHPVFAIVDLYLKWLKYGDQDSWTAPEHARMAYVVDIMEVWQRAPPAEFLKLRPQASLNTRTLPTLSRATQNDEENNDGIDTPTRRPAEHVLDDLEDGPLSAADAQAVIANAIVGSSKAAKAKGKAVANQSQTAMVAGPSNAHASTSGAVSDGEDGDAPAVTARAKGGKKPAPSKPRRAGPTQAKKRRREEDDGDDEEEADRPTKQGKGKGKQKASKSEQAAEVEMMPPSKPKRSRKKNAR